LKDLERRKVKLDRLFAESFELLDQIQSDLVTLHESLVEGQPGVPVRGAVRRTSTGISLQSVTKSGTEKSEA